MKGHSGYYLVFKEKNIRKRGLGSFNLRRKHGLFAYIDIEKQVRIRNQACQAIQPPESLIRIFERLLQWPHIQRWRWRQGRWHEGLNGFARSGRLDVRSEPRIWLRHSFPLMVNPKYEP